MRNLIQDSRFENGPSKGFTLIEMIVAIAIFMVVAVVAVGSLVRIVALNRQAQTLQSSVNNVSFALDSLAREVRQGSKISCLRYYDGSSLLPNGLSGDCENLQLGANSLIAFQTGKTAIDQATGQPCNLYYAYWFKKPNAGVNQYVLNKAQQTYCNQYFNDNGGNGNYYPIIDASSVTLTGYNLAVFSGSSFLYKWVYIRLQGYAGLRVQDQNFFDVQTSVSQRVND